MLELEHSTRVEELNEEINDMGDDALLQMKASEKVSSNSCFPKRSTDECYRSSIQPLGKSKQDFCKHCYDNFAILAIGGLAIWEYVARGF